MKNDLLTELSNKFIDKELTESEEQILTDLLKDEDNKKYFESFTSTFNTLEAQKPADKKINVRNSVLDNIKTNNSKTLKEKVKDYFSDLLSGDLSRYAASFALGGFFVVLFFMLLPQSSMQNDSFMQGVMGNNINDETHFYDEASFTGEIKVQYPENIVVLDIDINSAEIIDCDLNYEKDQLSLFGIKTLKAGGSKTFNSGHGTIKLTDIGSNHYLVFFKRVKNQYGKVFTTFYRGSELITNSAIEIKN